MSGLLVRYRAYNGGLGVGREDTQLEKDRRQHICNAEHLRRPRISDIICRHPR